MNSKILTVYSRSRFNHFLGMILYFFIPLLIARADDSIEDKFNSITPEQREMFNIVFSEWKPASSPPNAIPEHAYFVGCRSCEGANYSSAGVLLNPNELHKIPTSWILKFPNIWNGRVVVIIPPGVADQVQVFTTFSGAISAWMNEGYAIASMNHPGPGFPGFNYDDFIGPPYKSHDYRNAYIGTGHMLRDLVSEIFGAPVGFYAFSASRGTSMGGGLLASEASSPFDGFVLGTGGNGLLQTFMLRIEAYLANPNKVPLTGLVPLQTTPAAKVANLIGPVGIGLADREYRAFVLSGATANEQLARAVAYNVEDRPRDVQRSWGDLELAPDIKKPTIIFQGLKDRTVYPDGALTFTQGIVDAGKSNLYRLYLLRNMTHGGPPDPPEPPASLLADAIRKLDAWVQSGAEPGSLEAGPFGFQPSCATLGFGQDPMGCFCNEMEGVDFEGQPIPECN